MFHSQPSSYLFDDEVGETHTIHQGEGGEQGDAGKEKRGNDDEHVGGDDERAAVQKWDEETNTAAATI